MLRGKVHYDRVILLGMEIVLEGCVRRYRHVKIVKLRDNNSASTGPKNCLPASFPRESRGRWGRVFRAQWLVRRAWNWHRRTQVSQASELRRVGNRNRTASGKPAGRAKVSEMRGLSQCLGMLTEAAPSALAAKVKVSTR